MIRLGSLILCAAFGFGAALSGCGSSSKGSGTSSALDLVPKSNEIAGWNYNPNNSDSANGPATATTEPATEALIDGAAADFFAAPSTPVLFAWQTYLNTTVSTANTATGAPDTNPEFVNGATLDLKILQMPSTAQAAGLYASLRAASLYAGKTWAEPTSPKIGTDSRLADTGDHWWINFYQGDFYVEVSMGPSYSPPPDFTPGNTVTRDLAFAFAAAVAGKI